MQLSGKEIVSFHYRKIHKICANPLPFGRRLSNVPGRQPVACFTFLWVIKAGPLTEPGGTRSIVNTNLNLLQIYTATRSRKNVYETVFSLECTSR